MTAVAVTGVVRAARLVVRRAEARRRVVRRAEARRRVGLRTLAALSAALVVLAAGCGGGSAARPGDAAPGATAPALTGELTVSAASSLRDAFAQIGERFTADHPGVTVTFNLDASSALAAQIREGAPVDVVATADPDTMAGLVEEGLVAGSPSLLARNGLAIVTKPGNPAGVTGLADLPGAGVVALCGRPVPCGRYAQQALDAAGVAIPESRVTRGQHAGATLTAVTEGDAAAGIVYRTDARAAGEAVEVVSLPAHQDVAVAYPVAVLARTPRPAVAEAFVAFVLGPEGQATLRDHGFGAPG